MAGSGPTDRAAGTPPLVVGLAATVLGFLAFVLTISVDVPATVS